MRQSLLLLFGIVALAATCASCYKLASVGEQNNTLAEQAPGPRIISGSNAMPSQFPWQVILKRDEYDDLLCGGSIISNRWVLTAGHCVYGLRSLYLMFGTIDLYDDSATSMTSKELFLHPDYNAAYLNNDVGLVKLPDPLQFHSNNIQPITLSSALASKSFVGTVATITGFGLIDDQYLDYSPILQYANVQIIDNLKCEGVFGKNVVTETTMCADGYNGSNMSTCSGDSGGPLIIRNDTNGEMVQIGINSFVAQDRCTLGYPSGYARVSSYLDFITKTTGIPTF